MNQRPKHSPVLLLQPRCGTGEGWRSSARRRRTGRNSRNHDRPTCRNRQAHHSRLPHSAASELAEHRKMREAELSGQPDGEDIGGHYDCAEGLCGLCELCVLLAGQEARCLESSLCQLFLRHSIGTAVQHAAGRSGVAWAAAAAAELLRGKSSAPLPFQYPRNEPYGLTFNFMEFAMLPPERVASLKAGGKRKRRQEKRPKELLRRCQMGRTAGCCKKWHGRVIWTLEALLCPWEALAPFGQYGITLDEELRVLKIEGKDQRATLVMSWLLRCPTVPPARFRLVPPRAASERGSCSGLPCATGGTAKTSAGSKQGPRQERRLRSPKLQRLLCPLLGGRRPSSSSQAVVCSVQRP